MCVFACKRLSGRVEGNAWNPVRGNFRNIRLFSITFFIDLNSTGPGRLLASSFKQPDREFRFRRTFLQDPFAFSSASRSNSIFRTYFVGLCPWGVFSLLWERSCSKRFLVTGFLVVTFSFWIAYSKNKLFKQLSVPIEFQISNFKLRDHFDRLFANQINPFETIEA